MAEANQVAQDAVVAFESATVKTLRVELHARTEAYRHCHQQHEELEAAHGRLLALLDEIDDDGSIQMLTTRAVRRALEGTQ